MDELSTLEPCLKRSVTVRYSVCSSLSVSWPLASILIQVMLVTKKGKYIFRVLTYELLLLTCISHNYKYIAGNMNHYVTPIQYLEVSRVKKARRDILFVILAAVKL